MDSEPGHSMIVWSVRLSVALYMVATFCWLRPDQKSQDLVSPESRTAAADPSILWYRRCWMAAWVLCLIHVTCAYHFQHHWSQTAAQRHTAELTQRVTGLYWSGGLYINYAFLVWWGLDVLRCHRRPMQTSP